MTGRIDTSRLLAATNIVDVVGSRIEIKKKGKNYSSCCPFHDEKTPSFTVSREKQFFHCFGCGAHGDAIAFLQQYDSVPFPVACEWLAKDAGIDIGADAPRNDSALLKARRARETELIERSLMQEIGILALGAGGDIQVTGDKSRGDVAKSRAQRGLARLFDVAGPANSGGALNILYELNLLFNGLLDRITEREHGGMLRSIRPERGRYPLEPWPRETLAARRIYEWLAS